MSVRSPQLLTISTVSQTLGLRPGYSVKTRLESLSLLQGMAGWELLTCQMETAKPIVQQTESGNNRTELTGTEIFSFHDHTGIPQKRWRKQSSLEVGKPGTGTLYPNGLAKAWLTGITCAFLNYPFSSTRDVKRARETDHIVFFWLWGRLFGLEEDQNLQQALHSSKIHQVTHNASESGLASPHIINMLWKESEKIHREMTIFGTFLPFSFLLGDLYSHSSMSYHLIPLFLQPFLLRNVK